MNNAAVLTPRIREMLRAQMGSSVSAALDTLPNQFMQMGSQARSNEDYELILRTLRTVSRSGRAFAEDFDDCLREVFEEKLRWIYDSTDPTISHAFANFDLLDDGVLAQQMSLRKLVQKTLEELDTVTLAGIETRMCHLFENGLIKGVRNPVGPGTVLKALQRACQRQLTEDEMRAALANAMQPHLAAGLRALYFEMNTWLVKEGVLPDYRPIIERDQTNRVASVPQNNSAGAGMGVTLSQTLALHELLPNRASSPIDLSAIVSMLMEDRANNKQYGARLLGDSQGTLYAHAVETPASADLLAELTELQHNTQAGRASGAHKLENLVQHMEEAGEHPLDRLTGELVSVVFDYLLRDRPLAEAVKTEVSRLQIVALKAALLDRSFFARREHPMRALLDEIATLTTDPSLDTSAKGAFVSGLRKVVDDLTTQFEADLSLFDQARERIQALVRVAAQEEEEALAHMTAQLLAEERQQHVRGAAADEVAHHLEDDTPAFIKTFLDSVWVEALARARLDEGEQSPMWGERIAVMERLLDSVKPKTPETITTFRSGLRSLISALQDGMRAAEMEGAAQARFLDQLMAAHTMVLIVKTAAPAQPRSKRKKSKVPEQSTLLALQQQMVRGTVVEFCDEQPPVRAKLMWVSPGRSRYVFSTRGGNPRVLALEELAEGLKQGKLRHIETEDLVEAALHVRGPDSIVPPSPQA